MFKKVGERWPIRNWSGIWKAMQISAAENSAFDLL